MNRITKLLNSDKSIKWLFYGDSITDGIQHTFGYRDYTELFSERVRFELERHMDIISNTAISGNNTRNLISSFDWRVGNLNPDIVFLMIGMNDCSDLNDISIHEFEDNLLELINKITNIDAIPILQTSCPILPEQAPDRLPYFDSYMDIIRKIASDNSLPLIDHNQFWKEHIDKHFYWMSNAFHPNHYGHRSFAKYIYNCLDIDDNNSHSCNLFIP